MNYTAREVPYTRVIEHKHFTFGQQEKTVITREYPAPWQPGEEPYYPVNDGKNQALLARYQQLAQSRPEVRFGGRLGSYRYYNMDQVIRAALDDARRSWLNCDKSPRRCRGPSLCLVVILRCRCTPRAGRSHRWRTAWIAPNTRPAPPGSSCPCGRSPPCSPGFAGGRSPLRRGTAG